MATYETRHMARQKVRYNSTNPDNPLKYQLVINGAKVTPTSATITIYAPGSSTALVSAASMSLSGSVLTYSVTTTTTASWPINEGYRAEIAVTYSAVVYSRVIFFDVVKFLLELNIGRDQLVALDDEVRAMDHAGDEDFSEVIMACRDELQVMIESHVIGNEKLVENMILDNSAVAICARHYILARIFKNKGATTKADDYDASFKTLFKAVLASIKYDTSQSGEEGGTVGGLQAVRLSM